MCNTFLPAKDDIPHRLCTSCLGKMCSLDNHYEECHDWFDECCQRIGEYIAKLSVQREKCKRKAEASSASFSGFSLAVPVLLCLLPSPKGSGIVTTTPSSSV